MLMCSSNNQKSTIFAMSWKLFPNGFMTNHFFSIII